MQYYVFAQSVAVGFVFFLTSPWPTWITAGRGCMLSPSVVPHLYTPCSSSKEVLHECNISRHHR
jgi:hypothetical protein